MASIPAMLGFPGPIRHGPLMPRSTIRRVAIDVLGRTEPAQIRPARPINSGEFPSVAFRRHYGSAATSNGWRGGGTALKTGRWHHRSLAGDHSEHDPAG